MPSDLEIFMSEDNPSVAGDIKIVKGTLEVLDDCDAITQWSVESGAGVTIEVDHANVAEGTGSIKVGIPKNSSGAVTCTFSAKDLRGFKFLRAQLRREGTWIGNFKYYFGETAWNEQTANVALPGNSFSERYWDISGIGDGDRDAVTTFTIYATNTSLGSTHYFWIDYVVADPGPSAVKAFDGDRVILLYPKAYVSHYHGTGVNDLQIDIARKGTPSRIQIDGMVTRSILWTTDMAAGHSKRMANDTADNADITDGIKSVGDCYFTVGTAAQVNTNGTIYHYTVWWND